MGQKRITVVDLSAESDEQARKISAKAAKKKGAKIIKSGKGGTGRITDKSEPIEIPETKPQPTLAQKSQAQKEIKTSEEIKPKVRPPRVRSKRYQKVRSRIDRTKFYPLEKAVELVKKTNITRFDGTVSAHLNLKQDRLSVNVTFPHSIGKKTTVAIADDKLLKQIEKGKLDFDILLATRKMMPKLVKHAKTLGPKGLMPNPKNGTLTNEPKKKKKELEAGAIQIKNQAKYPLMHVRVGKTSQKDKELVENIKALINAISLNKIKKVTLASTMSPGIKIDLHSI